jgi:uncharacterized protein YggE
MIKKILNDTKYAISAGILSLILVALVLVVYLVVRIFNYADPQPPFENTITLTGEGEVVVVPDVATFTYTVREASETVATAQQMATEKSNRILALLKENEVDEKDIKTLSYNIFPKYEWQAEVCLEGQFCRGGNNVIVGHEVSQTVQVKVKDTTKAGDLLGLIGDEEVQNVSGLTFSVGDEESLKKEARQLAIEDAKEKADALAKQLGIELDDIVSFSEESEGRFPGLYGMGGGIEARMMSADSMASPEISLGENTVKSTVYITFEIE